MPLKVVPPPTLVVKIATKIANQWTVDGFWSSRCLNDCLDPSIPMVPLKVAPPATLEVKIGTKVIKGPPHHPQVLEGYKRSKLNF